MNDLVKIGLVATSINVPTALKLLRAHDPDVGIFVAGDQKTPHDEVRELMAELQPNAIYLSPTVQSTLGYKCSDLIGWNTIARRNIATLEALKWGADIIVLWDDDNLPLNSSYFGDFQQAFTVPFNGLQASSASGWFDVGALLQPEAPHRGFPHTKASPPIISHTTNAKVGVAAGICLGDPDISAVTRIARSPTAHQTSRLLDAGIVVDPSNWTVFNSQNTAFVRELAPCFLMVPQFQRFDDILASLVAQKVMQERELHVHFGQPYIWQQRNPHDLLKDLQAELWGETNILRFAEVIDYAPTSSLTNIEMVERMYTQLSHADLVDGDASRLVDAWLEDISKVLG